MIKNLKHGIKCTKTDTVLECEYCVYCCDHFIGFFVTKLEAINVITQILSDGFYKSEDITLLKVQFIKF